MRSLWRWAAIVALLLVLGGTGSYLWVDSAMKRPHAHTLNGVLVIEQGMGRKAIVNRLVEAGVLSEKTPVLIYLALNPQMGIMQAGEYRFDSPISPLSVLEKLRRGEIATEQLTIPEGYDIYDVEEALNGLNGATRAEVHKALHQGRLVTDLDPNASNLEGYLYPDTYSYTSKTTPEQIVMAMVKRFRQVWTPERQKRATELGMSLREVLTLASLIEEEAKLDEERPLISAVFHNRLKRGMKLDCDPSFIYAAKLEDVWDHNVNNPLHRKRNSPYNTYVVTGLPPGPISSPREQSIDAALHPATVDYLYFVVNGSEGRHKFSRTEAEHLTAVAEYRRQQRATNN